MNADRLLHCSNPQCAELVYLSESVRFTQIPHAPNTGGRYCVACARAMGYFTPADELNLEQLLEAAGMINQPAPWERPRRLVRHRPGPNPDQGVLL